MPRRPRSEERGLDLLRSETNRSILDALERSPSTEAELTAWLVLRTRGKLRRHLDTLLAAKAVESRRLRGVRRRVEYRLTEIGQGLVAVISGVERWLGQHPERHLETVSPVGWRAFALLVDAWTAGVVQELARGPKDLTHLAATTRISPARLGEALLALEGAAIITTARSQHGRADYVLTDWGIRGIGVLALSSHWQRIIGEHAAPVSIEEALVALNAALKLARLQNPEAGTCALTIEFDGEREGRRRSGGLRATISGGRVDSAPAAAGQGPAEAWVRGTVGEWLAAAVGGRTSAVYIGGRRDLAVALLVALHTTMYGG